MVLDDDRTCAQVFELMLYGLAGKEEGAGLVVMKMALRRDIDLEMMTALCRDDRTDSEGQGSLSFDSAHFKMI